MAGAYRLLYAELLSGDILGELPAISVSTTDTLNAAGSLTATIPLTDTGAREMPALYYETILDEGPLALYKMAEPSGTSMVDSGPSGLDGTYVNGVTLAATGPTEVITRAASFDAINDRGEVLAPPFDFSGNAPFTVEFWVNVTATPTDFDRLVSFESTSNDDGWWIVYHGTQGIRVFRQLNGATAGFESANFGSAITFGQWYHVAAVYTGARLQIYRDGALMADNVNTDALPADPADLIVNKGVGSTVCGCKMAGLSIWDRALDADEVARHYALGSGDAFDIGSYEQPQLYDSSDLAVARTAVYLERDGVILWGGILWTARADLGADTLELGCAGFHSYFGRRTIRGTTILTADDQFDIARYLLDYAQAFVAGDIGVQDDSELSGVLRDRTWQGYERKPIAEAIEQLALVEDGFDFSYVSDRSGVDGGIVTTLRMRYPAEGRQTDYVFEVGVNCAVLEYSEDGTTIANVVDAIGAGDGDDQIMTTAVNSPLIGPYPLLEDVISFTDVSEVATLGTHARRRLSRGAGPMRNITISVFPDSVPTLGSYAVGDQVRVVAHQGWVSVDDTFRIVEMSLDASDGAEVITLTLAGLEAFEAV